MKLMAQQFKEKMKVKAGVNTANASNEGIEALRRVYSHLRVISREGARTSHHFVKETYTLLQDLPVEDP